MNKRQKNYAAIKAEEREWSDKVKAAKAACDAITDLEALAEAARAWLLAKADEQQYVYGRRAAGFVAMYRRRANSDDYRTTLAVFWLAERLKKAADEEVNMSASERREYEALIAAESRALTASIHALIAGAHRSIRT